MNGKFFILDTADPSNTINAMDGKYLCHYNDTWVISKEPTRSVTATGYGSADEFETLYDLQQGAWLPVPVKTITDTITAYSIVDVNIIGSFVDYVVRYTTNQSNAGVIKYIYFRDRNVDGVFSTTNYSILNNQDYDKSILGAYDGEQTYIKQFNNSVMLYPNLRMVINGNAVQSYSWTVINSRIGTILVPFGDLQEDFLPFIVSDNQKTYIISKTAMGYIRIIRLGTDIPDRIERVAQYVHKINTVDVLNILVERESSITAEHGSLDWNNKFEVVNNITDIVHRDFRTYHINSAYNANYEMTGLRSASMIIDDTTISLYGLLYNTPITNNFNLTFFNIGKQINIDVYYDTVQPSKYKYSIINGIQRFNTLFTDLSFPLGVIVPFPVGTKWSMHNETVAVGKMSVGLMAPGLMDSNRTLDLYLYSRQIYFGEDSFILFGIQYVFDGDFIYQESEQIAMAFGYKFLGCDNLSAYFYSSWDKSVYQFTGARTLTKILNLTNRSEVKIGRYDGYSGEMILLTKDEIIKKRENVLMNFSYMLGNNIIPTKNGGYIQLVDGKRVLLSPLSGEIDALEIITEFLGIDGSTVCDYERIDIRLYSPDKKPVNFTAEMQTINQDTKESEQKRIELKSNDFSLDGYKTVKLIPQYKKGTGLSLRIRSEGEIFIAGIEVTFDGISRTANSQRTGY
jgi:hypothetical protein